MTIDLGGYTLNRRLTKRGEGGGQVITVRKDATLNLSNGTLKGGGGVCNYGEITFNNCIITGNRAQLNGGGIWDGRAERKVFRPKVKTKTVSRQSRRMNKVESVEWRVERQFKGFEGLELRAKN